MWMKMLFLLLQVFFSLMSEAKGQCTFQSEFRGTTWHDNTKGTLTFTDTTMTGWNFLIRDIQTVDSWQCLDNTSSNYLILRSSSFVTVVGSNYYAYLCLKLTSITSYSYYYYQMFAEQPNAGGERVKFDKSSTLTGNDACNSTFPGQDSEFHVLVKSGFESNAAVTCPESLLFSGDYLYLNNDGSFDCNGTTDVMDVCSDTTAVTYDYSNCSQRIGYSENGSFYCVASLTFGGYDYAVLYNRDSTITVTDTSNYALNHDTETTRFSCLCTDGLTASVSPHDCTTLQTPSAYPTLSDSTTVNGYLLVFNGTKYVTCPTTTTTTMAPTVDEDSGLASGAIAAIVVVVLLLVIAVIIIIAIYLYLRSRKNKVSELEKPIIARNGVQPHVETIDETAKGNKLLRERSTLSREGTTLSRQGTMTSLKKQSSNLSGKKVTAGEDNNGDTTKEEKPFLGLSFLAFCPCKSGGDKSEHATFTECMGGICSRMKQGGQSLQAIFPCGKSNGEATADDDIEAMPNNKTNGKIVPPKKGPSVKGSKLATKDRKGVKAKPGKTKDGKDSKDKVTSNQTQTDKSALKSKEKLTKSDIILVNTPRPGSPSKEVETITVKATETSKGETKTSKSSAGEKSPKTKKKKKGKPDNDKGKGKSDDNATDTEKEKSFDQEKSKLAREKTDVSGVSSVRRPGTAISLSGIDSDVHAEENIQPKPTQKKKFLDWNFLMCLQGNRSPEIKEEDKEEPHTEPVKTVPKKPEKVKGVKGKKGEKKGRPKDGKKAHSQNKKSAMKKETEPNKNIKSSDNSTEKDKANDGYARMPDSGRSTKENDEKETSGIERSKTLPLRREETTVTLQDGKIAVDVYVPDEKTKLQLKDTVRNVEDKKGKDTIKGITKAKTTLGTTRPASSKEKSEKEKNLEKPKKPAVKKTGSKGQKSKPTGGANKKKKKT